MKFKSTDGSADWTPWTDLVGPKEKYEQTRYVFDERGVCTDYRFRGRAVNSYCAGEYSPTLETTGGCIAPVVETAPQLTVIQTTLAAGCNVVFNWL